MAGELQLGGTTLATHTGSGASAKINLDSGLVFPALGNSAVGTVSESSGTPTGDIIERGSNANGKYVKFADGTQICTSLEFSADSTNLFGALYRTGIQHWTFPAAFVDSDARGFGFDTPGNPISVVSASFDAISTTQAQTAAFTVASTASRGWVVSAIGHWY